MKKNLKVIAAIQARMGSKRLPGKVLRTIEDKTMIEHIWERLKACKEVDQIVLATSTQPENDVLIDHAQTLGLAYIRGSEEDLIQRHSAVLETYEGNALIRITADCPLVDPLLIDAMVCVYRSDPSSVDLVTNVFPRTFPKGLDIEILPRHTLKRLNKEVEKSSYRELLTSYIMEYPQEWRIKNFSFKENLSGLRWTVDYQEDLLFVEKIFEALGKKNKIFTMKDILAFLKKNPKIAKINEIWIGK